MTQTHGSGSSALTHSSARPFSDVVKAPGFWCELLSVSIWELLRAYPRCQGDEFLPNILWFCFFVNVCKIIPTSSSATPALRDIWNPDGELWEDSYWWHVWLQPQAVIEELSDQFCLHLPGLPWIDLNGLGPHHLCFLFCLPSLPGLNSDFSLVLGPCHHVITSYHHVQEEIQAVCRGTAGPCTINEEGQPWHLMSISRRKQGCCLPFSARLFSGAAFFHLNSAALPDSTSLPQPVVQQGLLLGWGPTIPAVMPRLKTGHCCIRAGRQHPHMQGTMLGKFLSAPPMARVSQLCWQISVGGPGLLCTAFPAALCSHPLSINQQGQHTVLLRMRTMVGQGCSATLAPVGSAAATQNTAVPSNHSALTLMRSLFRKQHEK